MGVVIHSPRLHDEHHLSKSSKAGKQDRTDR